MMRHNIVRRNIVQRLQSWWIHFQLFQFFSEYWNTFLFWSVNLVKCTECVMNPAVLALHFWWIMQPLLITFAGPPPPSPFWQCAWSVCMIRALISSDPQVFVGSRACKQLNLLYFTIWFSQKPPVMRTLWDLERISQCERLQMSKKVWDMNHCGTAGQCPDIRHEEVDRNPERSCTFSSLPFFLFQPYFVLLYHALWCM